MINKKQGIEIAKNFINSDLKNQDWFLNIESAIKAFVLYGSVAKGTNKPNSDIDILIILPLEQEEKYTKGEYFYDYQNQRINIVLRSIEKLRVIAKGKKDLFQKEVFRECEILKDTYGEVADLIKEIEKI